MKTTLTVLAVGAVLTTLGFLFFISNSPFVQRLSDAAHDQMLQWTCRPPQSGRIAIVDIDDVSIKELGQWPWPRDLVGRLTQSILDGGARVVGFDVIFSEPDRTSPNELEVTLAARVGAEVRIAGVPDTMRDFDEVFARVIRDKPVILGCSVNPCERQAKDVDPAVDPYYRSHLFLKGKGRVHEHLMQAEAVTPPIRVLNAAAAKAALNAVQDADGIVRANPLVWALGESRLYPTLALEAVRIDQGNAQCIVEYDENGVTRLRLPPIEVPCDHQGRLTINYRQVREREGSAVAVSFPTYRARDVLTGTVNPDALRDRIVLVGTSAVGLKDIKATPLTQHFSGVEIQASIIDNLLAGDMLWRPSWIETLHGASIAMIGLLLTLIVARSRAWVSFLCAALLVLAAVAVSALLLRLANLVFVPVWATATVVTVYPVLTMIRYWQEEAQKRKIRGMFGTMVSPEVLRYLEDNPGSFSLSGSKAEATMFFSDLAGFTPISESMESSRLSELLNRYLSPMSDIIMARRGYVDKYEGDAIMAEWGVPFAVGDHAVHGCLAALEQQERLAELRPVFRRDFGHDIHARMGLNSGLVTAGNMGAERRFQYTVMGDAVNLASRLEPVNKEYGTLIIIGETTYERARDAIEARLVDKILVKGKSLPVRIYELLARKGALAEGKRNVVALYEEALARYWRREWDAALSALDAALRIEPDSPSLRLRERILALKATPPPDTWQGEYAITRKD